MSETAATVIMIRHGETDWNQLRLMQGQTDIPLNDKGIAQAQAAALALADYAPSHIYSSDLSRAAQTARIAATLLGLGVDLDARLRERHFGIIQGLTMDQFQELHPHVHAQFVKREPNFVIPGGESASEFHRRAILCVQEIASRHSNGTVAVISHGGVLSALLRQTFGISPAAPRNFALENASLNIFRISEEQFSLVSWGITRHLPRLDANSALV